MTDDIDVVKADAEKQIAEIKSVKDKEVSDLSKELKELQTRYGETEQLIRSMGGKASGDPDPTKVASDFQNLQNKFAKERQERDTAANTQILQRLESARKLATDFADYGVRMEKLLELDSLAQVQYCANMVKEHADNKSDPAMPRPSAPSPAISSESGRLNTPHNAIEQMVEQLNQGKSFVTSSFD